MYDVELHKLYEVMASSQYTEDSDFCPVMVKISNEDIIAENGGRQYLLQVWSIKGELVFEKPMEKPVTSWNVSRNKLLFQEDDDNPNLVYLVKLFIDKPPVAFKFYLPEDRRVRPQELSTKSDPKAANLDAGSHRAFNESSRIDLLGAPAEPSFGFTDD